MFCLFRIFLSLILLLLENQRTLIHGQPNPLDQKLETDVQEAHIDSIHQSESQTGQIAASDYVTKHISKRGTISDLCPLNRLVPIDGYFYRVPPYDHVLQDIISVGYAYLLAIKHKVIEKNPRYFDITEFLDRSKSHVDFPPYLPAVCFVTEQLIQGATIYDYGRAHIFQSLQSKNSSFIQSTSRYMVQRHKMYELGTLISSAGAEQKETLRTKCSEATYTTITVLISELIGTDTIQAMSPNYVLEQFNEIAQMFIADTVAYEMIREGCRAMGPTRIPAFSDEWTPIADKLRRAANDIRNNWHQTQLQKDVQQAPDFVPKWGSKYYQSEPHDGLADTLGKKYYPYGFRVSVHDKWTTAKAGFICNALPNQKCFDKQGKLFLVRWKSLRLAGHVSPFWTPENYYNKLPEIAPPATSYRFSELYAKVQTSLKKVQNAVNNIRVTELQKTHYKQATDLFHAFQHAPTYGIYSETAEGFAKFMDGLNVLIKEFRPIVTTISEVAMHTGEGGINEVWALFDRSFYEMDFYMADIEEHIMKIREILPEETRTLSAALVAFDTAHDDIQEIRRAFFKYMQEARFYTKESNHLGTARILKDFTDTCDSVTNGIEKKKSVFENDVGTPILYLGRAGPFYAQTFLLVHLYDTAYLTLYGMFCTGQKYRLASAMAKGGRGAPVSASDMQLFVAKIQKDMSDITEKLDTLLESATIWAHRIRYYWIDVLINYSGFSARSFNQASSDAVAANLKQRFRWMNFSVVVVRRDLKDHTVPFLQEIMYYDSVFSNPDYSSFFVRDEQNLVTIVNWVPDKRTQRQNVPNFGFKLFSDSLCNKRAEELVSSLGPYQNIKSLFVWRTYMGQETHMLDLAYEHTRNGDSVLSSTKVDHQCCAFAGTSFAVKHDMRSCWYRHDSINVLVSSGINHYHQDDKVGIYALGHFGEEY